MRSLHRTPAAELMDEADVAPAALAHALADLRVVNRWFGGTRAALQALLPEIRRHRHGKLQVLDVGTGSGDIPLALLQAARRRDQPLRVVATDMHPGAVSVAAARLTGERDIEVRQADGLALPFDDGEFDLTMCHTALHHFEDEDALQLLRELTRCARRAVVVTDLVRGLLPLAAVTLLSHSLWRGHPITRHDSVVSVRAAFTPQEAGHLARQAGAHGIRIRRHPFFRFSLVGRPGRRG